MSYPWKDKGRYDRGNFSLDHLRNYTHTYKSSDGTTSYPVVFKFHFHCFTDHQNSTGDHRVPFEDPDFPGENRLFCPHRWSLSKRLSQILGGPIEGKRLYYAGGLQWVYNHRLLDIDIPYAIYMKFSPGPPGGSITVNVNSAYTKADFQKSGPEKRFDLLLADARAGKIPGSDLEKKK
ncbi:hypothetical protein [Azospirillum sp. B510]|uniref:hypothetical protein n=1 Tax=Azospirillum sp. (strain B510) TaxID=137722 RepID=UPI0011D0D2F5|nr:hypothetical protein [Azospirillum sp. B510]